MVLYKLKLGRVRKIYYFEMQVCRAKLQSKELGQVIHILSKAFSLCIRKC